MNVKFNQEATFSGRVFVILKRDIPAGFFFDVLLTVHLSIFISVFNQLYA